MSTVNGISIETPILYSEQLSKLTKRDVYLKLENVQPSGSFKLRGISHSCIEKAKNGCKKLVGSSGGNAGLALAYSALKLGIPCQLYVPHYVTPRMLARIEALNATVTIVGKNWQEANEEALKECRNNPDAAFIHPYDDPTLWDAYANIVLHLKSELKEKPSCVVVSVGGGGLLCGILKGLELADWKDIPVLAMETYGAECFNLSIQAGHIVEKPPVSIAKTLGATSVAPALMDLLPQYKIISEVLHDKDAVNGCIRFADDHGFLVEPSCGVSLASIYSGLLPNILERNDFDSSGPIVVIVCGGSDVTPKILSNFAKDFGLQLD